MNYIKPPTLLRQVQTYLNDFRGRITDESKMFGNIIQKCNIKLT